MFICVTCKKVMKCTLTGVPVRWDGSWVKHGDEYTCACGNQCVHVAEHTEGYRVEPTDHLNRIVLDIKTQPEDNRLRPSQERSGGYKELSVVSERPDPPKPQ